MFVTGVFFAWLILRVLSSLETGTLQFEDILPEDPRSYDKMKPPKKDGKATAVDFHVTVMSLDSINEYAMTYTADVFFAQSWKDHRLRLPENMTYEYRLLEVDWLKEMWRPDAFFKNAKQVVFQTMTIPNHYVWLYQDKTILYMVKLTLVLSCAMNFVYYPHDIQTCKLQIESISHTTDDLVFHWQNDDPLVVEENIQLPQLDLMETRLADCSKVYPTGNFTCLEVIFILQRRLGYYLFHTYIPTCLIVIMSWVSFWIKPEAAPARVTLGVTSLLTLSTQHARSQASLPPVSYVKSIDVFMTTCTAFVFLALMEYALVNVLLEDTCDNQSKVVRKRNRVAEGINDALSMIDLGKVEPLDSSGHKIISRDIASFVKTKSSGRDRALAVDSASRTVFPLMFAILNIAYWIVFLTPYL